jgi:hypothetical protein
LADDHQEITWEKGAGYWVATEKVSAAGCEHLLRLCLLIVAHSDNNDSYIVYVPSSEVDSVLKDPEYVPAIVRAIETGHPQFSK